jgi:cytoskeletal protein CcmA (bactofilin family)
MSLFNKPPNERMPQRLDTPVPTDGGSGSGSTPSVIAPGMKVIGDLETSGVVKIDGAVEGSIRGARQVLLGRSGSIQGDVHAEEAILAGKVTGTVVASERVEVQSTSRIDGDIHTKSIVVLEGGMINGNVRMDEGAGRTASIPSIPQTPRQPLSLSQ